MACNDVAAGNGCVTQNEYTRFFSRQLVKADDLTQDQLYYRSKRRLHNRLLHGWGIVCGLEVKPNPLSGAPLNVVICPGYALTPQGDEILVPTEAQFDVGQCIQGQGDPTRCHSPCSPVVLGAVDPSKEFYIGIRYTECQSRPVRVPPLGCGCDDTACEYSRIRDSYDISCLGKLPDSYTTALEMPPSVCDVVTGKTVLPCPPCPADPWIILAKVKVAQGRTSIESLGLNDRRPLLSVAVIQGYIRERCSPQD